MSTDTTTPRPEHPRPSFERADWLNLNGVWAFAYDPNDHGRQRGLPNGSSADFDQSIVVPFPWQSTLSGQQNVDYHGVAWYRRMFDVPQAWSGRRVFIRFGAVDYFADVWVNGQHAGSHEGGYTAFEFDITAHIRPDGNTVVVRVDDPGNLYEIPHGKQASVPPDPWQQFSFTSSSGIWQTVWLEARPDTYIDSVRFTPDVSGQQVYATIEIAAAAAGSATIAVTITAPDGHKSALTQPVELPATGATGLEIVIPIANPQLWDVHAPNLYTTIMSLTTAEGERDVIHTYFGMRQIEQRDGQIWLNGRPIYLMTALDQGYWPDGIYTAPSDAALKADVAYAKRIGLNGLRKHLKVEDPRFNYWADQLGLLLWCDMPCPNTFTELACQRLHRELMAMVKRDFNHPSIVIWCPYNETWGLEWSLQTNTAMQQWVAQLYDELKVADPTRLVVDNSGWSHVKSDLADFHYYTGNERDWRVKMTEYAQRPAETGVFTFQLMADGHTYDGTPLVVSEFGFGWQHDGSWGLRWSTNELRRHPQIVGYTFCELYDVEYEYCGYTLYDRTPKQFGYDLTMINSADYIVLDNQGALSRFAGDDIRIPVLYSAYEHPPITVGTLRWALTRTVALDTSGTPLLSGELPVTITPYTVTPVGEIRFTAPNTRGAVQLQVWLDAEDGTRRALNTLDFEIYNPTQSFFDQSETAEEVFFTLSAAPANKAKSFWNDGDHTLGYFVDDRPGAVWFEGSGKIALRMPVISRLGFPPILSTATLVLEMGSRPAEITQSVDGQSRPSDVTVSINGVEVATVTLRDLYVHAGGALTRIHNTGVGEHGELVEIHVAPDLLGRIVEDARAKGHLLIELEVKPDAPNRGGLTLFGSRTGRYGIDPTIRVGVPKHVLAMAE